MILPGRISPCAHLSIVTVHCEETGVRVLPEDPFHSSFHRCFRLVAAFVRLGSPEIYIPNRGPVPLGRQHDSAPLKDVVSQHWWEAVSSNGTSSDNPLLRKSRPQNRQCNEDDRPATATVRDETGPVPVPLPIRHGKQSKNSVPSICHHLVGQFFERDEPLIPHSTARWDQL